MKTRAHLAVAVLLFVLSCFGGGRAVADEKPDILTIATWNLEWFFDEHQGDNFSELSKKLSAPSRADWEWKRDTVAAAIAKMKPTVLALQEVENQQVLYYLTQRLRKQHNLNYRIAFVLGADFYTGQDVALLYRSGLIEFGRRLQTQEQFDSGKYYNISKHQFAKFRWGDGDDAFSFTLLNVHLRARPEAANIRQRQMRLAKSWLDDFRRQDPNLIVLGDFNTEEGVQASAGSELAIVQGKETADEADDLIDLHSRLASGAVPATHMIGKAFDRILISKPLLDGPRGLMLKSVRIRRDLSVRGELDKDHRDGYYEIDPAERDLSDHFPIVAEFQIR